MRQVVAGVDDEVRLQLRQAGAPTPPCAAAPARGAGRERCSTRSGPVPGGQHRHGRSGAACRLALDQRPYPSPSAPTTPTVEGGRGSLEAWVASSHAARRPAPRVRAPETLSACPPSRTACRPTSPRPSARRDALRAGTLRMVLTAGDHRGEGRDERPAAQRRRGPRRARQGGEEAPRVGDGVRRRRPPRARRPGAPSSTSSPSTSRSSSTTPRSRRIVAEEVAPRPGQPACRRWAGS